MNELVHCKLPAEILALLLQRGPGLPLLRPHEHPIPLARRTLDELDDAGLFQRTDLRDAAMAAAARGLLYLWCGWPKECARCAEAAPEPEAIYLRALCDRQMRKTGAAKRGFQQLAGHPIHAALAAYAVHIGGAARDPAIRRFMRLVERDGTWEPFLFADLYEHAVSARLDRPGIRLVRRLVGKEAELLFRHCYEAAVGEAIAGGSDESPEPARAPGAGREAHAPAWAPKAASRRVPTRTAASGSVPPLPAALIRIVCPSCRRVATLPPSSRGRLTRCAHCQTSFRIPTRQTAGSMGG